MSAGKGLPLDILISIIAAVGFGLTALYVAIARRHRPTWTAGVILLCACAELTTAHILQRISSDQVTRIFWYKMVYLGFTVTPTAFLYLALHYSGLGHVLTNRTRLLLSIFPVLTAGLILTNEIHGLMWNPANTIAYATSSEFLAAGDAGIWYWASITYSYLAMGAGCFFLIRLLIRSRRIYGWQTSIVISAAVLAILGSMLDIFRVSPLPPFSTTALGLAVGSITVAYILSPLRRRDLLAVSRATVFNSISDAIIVVDGDKRVIDINLAAEKLVGRPASRALSRPLEHLLPALTSLLAHDASTNGEVALYLGKTQSNYDLRLSVIQDWRGHIVGQVIVLRDITERKLAGEALQQSEARYRDLVENSQDLICAHDLQGNLLFVNEAGTKILDYSNETLLKMNLRDILAPEVRDRFDAYLAEIQAKGQAHGLMRIQTAGGEIRYLEFKNTLQAEALTAPIVRGMARDVTEREQAEEALREKEARYRSLFEQTHDGVFILDLMGNHISVNQRAADMLGYTAAEIQKLSFKDLSAEITESENILERLVAGEQIPPYERLFRKKNGEVFPVEINVQLARDSKGNPQHIQSVVRDITERKQAEEALRQSEERFRNLYENSTIGIYRTTPDGRILLSNPAIVHMLGYKSFEELAKNNLEQDGNNAGYQRGKFREMIERDGEVRGIESEWKKRDGAPIFIRESAQLVRDDDGKILYYDGTVEDITEKKRAEEALRNSEIKLRSLFAAMLDVIIVYDADGRYLEIAPTNPANLYRPLDELLGKTVTELFPPDQASFFLDHIRQTLKTGQLTNAEYSLSVGDKVGWFSASVSPLSSNSVIWVAQDITDRKQAEERIKRQLEQLTALNEIDRMIASSFDLHLSLTSIVDRVISQQKVDAADILVMNPDLNILEFGAGHGFHTLGIEKGHLSLGEGYAGRAALERQTIHIPDLRMQVDNPIIRKALASENFVGYYAVPLIAKGKVKGVLEIFHRSPLDPDVEWLDFLNMLAGQAALAIDNATMFGNLQRSNLELTLAYDATIEGWSHALDLRDKETEGHTQRVTQMTVNLARAFGLNEAELVQVRRGGLLHDIGKMDVPDSILLKPGPLTDDEWVAMKKHPIFAYEMLSPIRYLRLALDIPYCHHEKWDGTGYPRGLKGEQIPLTARIFAVVDVWDALRSDRPYRAAWTEERVREHIRTLSGTHFDPNVAPAFLRLMEQASRDA